MKNRYIKGDVKRSVIVGTIACVMVGCGPATLEEVRCEGEAETRKLAKELEKIETQEELQIAVPKLRKRFNKIADVLIEVRKFSPEKTDPSLASEQLFAELARLYEMPRGRELVESAQLEAMEKVKRRK